LNAGNNPVALATKIDIGTKYHKILGQHPTLELYNIDSHPTKLSAYLNASLFYRLLPGSKHIAVTYYDDLDKKDAVLLQQLAN
jgi:hypothetical protein